MKNIGKRVTALLMTVCICLGLAAFPAFAEEEVGLKYVAVGDSFSNGFGFTDYYVWDETGNITGNNGASLTGSASAYPTGLAKHFGTELSSLAMTRIRTEEFYALIDTEGYLNSYSNGGDNYFNRIFGNKAVLKTASEKYTAELKEADVITLCLGESNFGAAFVDRLKGIFGSDELMESAVVDEAMLKAINSDAKLKKQLKEFDSEYRLVDTVRKVAALFDKNGSVDGTITEILDAIYYNYFGFALNFKAAYTKLRELNPNAEIIVVGLPNLLDGIMLSTDFPLMLIKKISLAEKFDFIVKEARDYMQETIKNDKNALYVDMPDVNTFFDELIASKGNPALLGNDLYTVIVQQLIDGQVGSISLKALVAAFRDIEAKGEASEYYAELGTAYARFAQIIALAAEACSVETLDIPNIVDHADDVGTLLKSDDLVSDYLTVRNEPWAQAVLYTYCRFIFADSLLLHPTAVGQRQIADAIAASGACFGNHDCTVKWKWADDLKSATCEITCRKNSLHNATLTDSNIDAALADGVCKMVYTASVTIDGNVLTDTVSVDVEHTYENGKCTHCGAIYPHNHSYTEKVTAPTCTSNGYTTYTCACGDSYNDKYTAALGHSYKEGRCTRCGAEDPNYKPVPAVSFTDVDGLIASFKESINWAVQNGITSGYSDNTFRPNATCTRGHVVTFLWRAAGSPEPQSLENRFSDVSESSPFYKAILWAAEQGITTGYADGTFRPNDACTRAHVVTFLWRYEGKPAASGSVSLTDLAGLNADFTAAINWAATNGITTGYADGTFRPHAVCTRAHVVTFIYRDMT